MVSATDTHVRMELEAAYRTVNVKVLLLDASTCLLRICSFSRVCMEGHAAYLPL